MDGDVSSATLIATLAARESVEQDLARLPAGVACVEVRADLVGDPDVDWLRQRFAGALLYTLRSHDEGGAFAGSDSERRARLAGAAGRNGYDAVDLEAARDCVPEVLDGVAPERRVVSWHGPAGDLVGLRERVAQVTAVPARLYKMVALAAVHGEELLPLALLRSLGRRDLVAFAAGAIGTWTRLLAPRFGAPVVYVAAADRTAGVAAPGQPSARRVIADFDLPRLGAIGVLAGVAGNPVDRSLSPRLHNTLYRELGIPSLYLPFHVESFGDFWLEVVESGSLDVLGLPLGGLSVTAPFKGAALAVAGAVSPLAERVGGANTLIKKGLVWEAETTDPEGVVAALLRRGVPLFGRRAAVLGAGGAGRAAAAGLRFAGAAVTVANRTGGEAASRPLDPRGADRGAAAAAALDVAFQPLEGIRPESFEILINATPLGRDAADALPFDVARLRPGTAVLDLVYGEEPTRLIVETSARGGVAIDGREVLLEQAAGQFRLMTGREMPRPSARAALGLPAETA